VRNVETVRRIARRSVRRRPSARTRRACAIALVLVAVTVSVVVPVLTIPRLPEFSPWPVAAGLLPWIVGKYVLCPLRWHAISESGRSRRWHLASYAESELFGLLTPGHVGADAWRVRRLKGTGMPVASAAAEVALDRLIGAVGLVAFVGFAASALPVSMALTALGVASAALAVVFAVRRVRPDWIPRRPLPPPRRLAHGLVLSMAYQASIVALLLGTLEATGHGVSPIAAVGAFGASQLAGAVPGPQGASPRDGALVVALMALGVPWSAALSAVTLKAMLAWAPGILLGGGCLLLARRYGRAGSGAGSAGTPAVA
jgi:hypothetical protein